MLKNRAATIFSRAASASKRRKLQADRATRHPDSQYGIGRRKSRPSRAASTASCWSPKDTPASRGGASAISQTSSRPRTWTSTSGSARPRSNPITRTSSITTGTGSGSTGCGEIGNQGVHQMDIARWAIGERLPKSVISMGGRWVDGPDFKDQGQTPNMQLTVMDFGGPLLIFEMRGLVEKKGEKGEFRSQKAMSSTSKRAESREGNSIPRARPRASRSCRRSRRRNAARAIFAIHSGRPQP